MLAAGNLPVLVAIGNTPKINASEVISIGRRRCGDVQRGVLTARVAAIHFVGEFHNQNRVFAERPITVNSPP